MKKLVLLVFITLFSLSFLGASADLSTSTNFKVERSVIDSGGSSATSSGFNLNTSIGQPGTGISTSTTFKLKGGFLYFVEPSVTVVPAPTPSPTPTPSPSPGSGGGGGGSSYLLPPTPLPGIPLQPGACTPDLNQNGRVNIVDLSIFLFYYGQTGNNISCFDFDGNGVVDFPDVSIMMFYWTKTT